jgi:hypothetical protein
VQVLFRLITILRAMIPRSRKEAFDALEVELRAEQVSSIRRVTQTLERALAQLRDIEAELPKTANRAALVSQHDELRAEAAKYLWYLVVQREAMGFRRHEDVHEIYRVPPPLTRRG